MPQNGFVFFSMSKLEMNLYTAMAESFSPIKTQVLKRGSFCLKTNLFLVRPCFFLTMRSLVSFRHSFSLCGGFFSHSSKMGTKKSGFHGFCWEKKTANLLIPNHKVTFGAKRVTFFLCQKMLICLDSLKKSHFAWNFQIYVKDHAITFFGD